jgi:hypothetical protein
MWVDMDGKVDWKVGLGKLNPTGVNQYTHAGTPTEHNAAARYHQRMADWHNAQRTATWKPGQTAEEHQSNLNHITAAATHEGARDAHRTATWWHKNAGADDKEMPENMSRFAQGSSVRAIEQSKLLGAPEDVPKKTTDDELDKAAGAYLGKLNPTGVNQYTGKMAETASTKEEHQRAFNFHEDRAKKHHDQAHEEDPDNPNEEAMARGVAHENAALAHHQAIYYGTASASSTARQASKHANTL